MMISIPGPLIPQITCRPCYDDGSTMPHNPFYNSKPWLDARAAQLARHPYCEICLMLGRKDRATQVDHRRAMAAGGHPLDPANLRSLCVTHHSQKTIMLDGAHKGGKQMVVTGPDGWPVHIEGPAPHGNQQKKASRRR